MDSRSAKIDQKCSETASSFEMSYCYCCYCWYDDDYYYYYYYY